MSLKPGSATQRDLFVRWPPEVTFDFANATDAQKEVLARENAHCNRIFPASRREWKTRYIPEPKEVR